MQEIKKRRIVLASVLKPVNDPRMYEKLGPTLADRYDVHVIGSPGEPIQHDPRLTIHQLRDFNRLSLYRLWAPFVVLRKVLSLKPSLLIVCTHELLFISLVAKLFTGCKTIYDVQENYWRNIFHTDTFPFLLRGPLAAYVRLTEWLSARFINFFFLAEAAYTREFSFPGTRKIILENKIKRCGTTDPERGGYNDGFIHLLFSGTIATTTGVFTAIDVASALHKKQDTIRLLIIGYCASPGTLETVRKEIADKPFIELAGGDRFVAHERIVSAIRRSDAGIIAYPPNPSTANAIPTKMYEYIGYRLPVIIVNHEPWVAIGRSYGRTIPFDPRHIRPAEILDEMAKKEPFKDLPDSFYWDSQDSMLLETVDRLMPVK